MGDQFKFLVEAAVAIQKSKKNVNQAILEIQKEAKIRLGIDIDKSTAKQVLKEQEKMQSQIAQTIKKRTAETAKIELAQAKSINKDIENQYKLRVKNEANLQKQLQQNFTLDLNKENFASRIDAWVKNNNKALPVFGSQIDDIKSKIQSADAIELKNLNKQFSTITKSAQAAGVAGDTFFTKIQKNIVQFARFMISATVSMTVINSFRMLIKNVVELDKSLTELLKVADLSGASLDQFKQKAFELGSQIGRTGKEVIDAVTTFKRAGYSINQSLDLSKAALTMTNVGDGIDNVSEASSALISVLKGFKLDDSQAMRIVDAINETSNNAAIDFDNITEGLRRVSGTLSQTGTSLEQTIGLLTGGFSQLRDIESVSSGLVFLSQRLRGVGEDGEKIDGLAPKIAKQFKEIANIDIEDANGELRSTYDIVADMARVLPTLTSKQRQYLSELAIGNRNVKTLNAILMGWKDVEAAVDSATNSLGSADKENAAFMNSIQGRMNAFQSAFQKLADNTINSEWIKKVVDFGTFLVNLVDTVGLLNIAIAGGLVWATRIPAVVSAITAAVTALGTALGISTGGASFLFAGLAALVVTIGTDLLNSTNAVNDAFLEQQQIVDELTTKVNGLKSEYDSLNNKQNRTPEEDQRLALLKEELSTQEALLKIEKQRAFDQQYGKQTVEFKGAFGYTETTDYDPLNKIKYDIQAYQDTLSKMSATGNLDNFDQLNEKLLNQKQTLINTNSELLNYKSVLGQLPPEFEEILNSLNDIIITENAISDNSNVFEFTDIISTTSDELESLQKQIDSIQSAYKTLSDSIVEYNDKGYLSLDTMQSIMALGDKYIGLLFNEQGQLELNKEAFIKLANAQLDEAEATALRNAISNVQGLTDEATATEYLKSKTEDATIATDEYTEAKLKQIAADKMAEGGDIAKATQLIVTTFNQYKAIIDQTRSSLGKYTDEVMGAGNATEEAARKMKQAYSSANSAINSLSSMVISMLKQRYQEADDADKKRYQKKIDRKKKEMDADKEEADAYYDAAQAKVQAQLDLLKAEQVTENYRKSLSEKETNKAKIEADLITAQLDDSEAGKKRIRELQEQLNSANSDIEDLQYDRKNSLLEDGLNKQLDAIQKERDAELQSIEDTYNARIESLENQLNRVESNARSEADIRNEAFELINEGGQQLYNDLLEYNRKYSTGVDADIQVAWQNAYKSLEVFGNGQINVLDTLNLLAIKMNDFNIATQKAAQSAGDLADEIARQKTHSDPMTDEGDYYSGLVSIKGSHRNGGVIDYTGLAMLHGTPSKPEAVVNSEQVSNFFKALQNPYTISSLISNSMSKNVSGITSGLSAITNNSNINNTPSITVNVTGDATQNTVEQLKGIANNWLDQAEKRVFSKMKSGAVLGY